MAGLSTSLGPLVSEISASDASATRIYQAVLKRHGFITEEMTPQEQLDQSLGIIVKFLVSSATAQEADDAAKLAREEALISPPDFEDTV